MRNKKPQRMSEDVNESARWMYNQNKQSMDPRKFRDALTKATKSIRGIPTNASQWNRWTP